MPHTSTHSSMEQCIDNCWDCHRVCLESVAHCLEKGGKHSEPRHISLLLECAEICQTSANFMLQGSSFHSRTCEVCAEVCDACAESCERLSADPEMKKCAEACRKCADSCRQMIGKVAA